MSAKNTKIWLVKLRPMGKYFFGGEKTFGLFGNDNYLIHSEKMPQQTALLGLMRQVLLEQDQLITAPEWRIKDRDKAEVLIGDGSFKIGGSNEKLDFGVIKNLSPVFLTENEKRYYPMPFDYGHNLVTIKSADTAQPLLVLDEQKVKEIPTEKKKDKERYFSGIGPFIPYDPKGGLSNGWMDGKGAVILDDKIFKEAPQPGVWKGSQGDDDEQGYYKQYFYKLMQDFAFAFYVELDDSVALEDTTITFGRERMPFVLEVVDMSGKESDLPGPPEHLYTNKGNGAVKVVLISDTYVPCEIYQHCLFAVSETKDFRCLQTTLNTKHYHNISDKRNAEQVTKSAKFNLLARGSTLYVAPNKLEEVKAMLDAAERFKQIGYNHYQILQPLTTQN